jgi:DNA-binding NtrC family response regulator
MKHQRVRELQRRQPWTKDRVLDELARHRRTADGKLPRPLALAAARQFGSLTAARRGLAARAHQRSLATLVEIILGLSIDRKLEVAERLVIDAALTGAGGNKTEAARVLGVHRKVLERIERRRGPKPPAPQAGVPLAHLVAAILEMSAEDKLEEVERAMILAASARARGNKSETARILGVNRKLIERRLARLS